MTNQVKTINGAEVSDWDAYVAQKSAATFYHDSRWRDFFADDMRKQCVYLASRDNSGSINGVLPLVRQKSRLFGNYLVSVPFLNYGGVLADSDAIRSALLDAAIAQAREMGVSHMELREQEPLETMPARTDKVAMILQLPADEEALSKSLGSKRRSQIRRPLREDPVVKVGGAELLDGFYQVFARNMRDLGTPVYPKSMFAAILRRFKQESLIVYIEVHGKPAAAGFVFIKNGNAEIPWASTVMDFNRISINMLLYWEVLKALIERGASQFDFGRSTADSGTYRFKKQWGAEPKQLYWNYWLREGGELPQMNPDNAKYKLAIQTWQKLPMPVANWLGPHIVTHLP